MTKISRTQAWCRLAVLIAEGLPAPKGISFHPDIPTISVSFQDEDTLHVWAERFELTLDPRIYDDGFIIIGGHGPREAWHGYTISANHYRRGERPAAAESVTEDMTAVREIAEAPAESVCERVGLHNNCATLGGWRNHSNLDSSPDASLMHDRTVSE